MNGDVTKRAAFLLESVIRELKSKRKIAGFGGVFIEDIRCWESWLREAHGLISSDPEIDRLRELNAELLAALKSLVAMDDEMNDPENENCGTYAGAYYAYYKGCSKEWDAARSVIAKASS